MRLQRNDLFSWLIVSYPSLRLIGKMVLSPGSILTVLNSVLKSLLQAVHAQNALLYGLPETNSLCMKKTVLYVVPGFSVRLEFSSACLWA